jgi:quercetin dioxygenase-like cupin family protein
VSLDVVEPFTSDRTETVMNAEISIKAAVTRRRLNSLSLHSLILTVVATLAGGAAAQPVPQRSASTRRDVIKQRLPGEPERDITLVEVTYPPGTGSPPHVHTNGVMAFVISGTIVSKVGDGPEQTFHAGDAWWEPEGAIHRVSRNASSTRERHVTCDLHRSQGRDAGRPDEAAAARQMTDTHLATRVSLPLLN